MICLKEVKTFNDATNSVPFDFLSVERKTSEVKSLKEKK